MSTAHVLGPIRPFTPNPARFWKVFTSFANDDVNVPVGEIFFFNTLANARCTEATAGCTEPTFKMARSTRPASHMVFHVVRSTMPVTGMLAVV